MVNMSDDVLPAKVHEVDVSRLIAGFIKRRWRPAISPATLRFSPGKNGR